MISKSYIIENKCRICFKKKLKYLLSLGNQPLANNLKKNSNSREFKLPLRLCFCNNCNTVQIKETVDPKILFKKYFWQTSTSESAKKFSIIFSKKILSYVDTKNPFVVEIASNDGTFLIPFKKNGCDVLGVDPAKNLVKISLNKNVEALNAFFNLETAKKIVKIKNKKADLIIARNVIAHVKNIHEIVESAYEVLNDTGLFVVEFHYAKEILKGLQYDSIYHEHLFYFNLETIKSFFFKKNFYLYHAFKSPISGGAIVALFSKSQLKLTNSAQKFLLDEKKNKVNSLTSWTSFAKRVKLHKSFFLNKINFFFKKKYHMIAYGASARSSTFLNYCKLDNKKIKEIVDKNSLKFKKFTPGINLKILSFEEFKKKIFNYNFLLLLAWNFKKEILMDLKVAGFKGLILIPFPKKNNIKRL
jgi:SAM-dependent methyltransferase